MASSGNKNINAKLVLGDVGAGQSSLVLRFVEGQFIEFQTSFDRAKKWVQELQAQGNPDMIMALALALALAGNKSDMLDARKVAAEEARTYAKKNSLFFMETSAKTANNVNDLFYEIDDASVGLPIWLGTLKSPIFAKGSFQI